MTALELASIIDSQQNAADERQTMERDALGSILEFHDFSSPLARRNRSAARLAADVALPLIETFG